MGFPPDDEVLFVRFELWSLGWESMTDLCRGLDKVAVGLF
jgi:hypothetical protein